MAPHWREREEKIQPVRSQELCPQMMVFPHTAYLHTDGGLLKATWSHFGCSGILAITTQTFWTHANSHQFTLTPIHFPARLWRAETDPQPINQVMVCLSLCHEEFSENPAAEGRKFTAETRSRAGAQATGKQLQREILELLSWDLCCWNSSLNISLSARGGKEGKDRFAWDSLFMQGCLSSSFGGTVRQRAVVRRAFWEAEDGSAAPSKPISWNPTSSVLVLP